MEIPFFQRASSSETVDLSNNGNLVDHDIPWIVHIERGFVPRGITPKTRSWWYRIGGSHAWSNEMEDSAASAMQIDASELRAVSTRLEGLEGVLQWHGWQNTRYSVGINVIGNGRVTAQG
ncbi:hypothetical protein ARMSODRAFT_966585 [Armillaria solidipes]|uniref:Uncharacterized protein n=1 Tax=Armillaria solidipes TaxID=1076256 RepID=A0A2H3AY50_9AGAR|nr:hypothetical protein ARMSODRAFT_966585 [Armillaria solidipes]